MNPCNDFDLSRNTTLASLAVTASVATWVLKNGSPSLSHTMVCFEHKIMTRNRLGCLPPDSHLRLPTPLDTLRYRIHIVVHMSRTMSNTRWTPCSITVQDTSTWIVCDTEHDSTGGIVGSFRTAAVTSVPSTTMCTSRTSSDVCPVLTLQLRVSILLH